MQFLYEPLANSVECREVHELAAIQEVAQVDDGCDSLCLKTGKEHPLVKPKEVF
jgi:hypothetical protein